MRRYWKYEQFRCSAKVVGSQIRVVIKGGAQTHFAPGEQFEFARRFDSAEAAQACLGDLPAFGPDNAGDHGFERVSWVMIN
jgi:hypothetical protein